MIYIQIYTKNKIIYVFLFNYLGYIRIRYHLYDSDSNIYYSESNNKHYFYIFNILFEVYYYVLDCETRKPRGH